MAGSRKTDELLALHAKLCGPGSARDAARTAPSATTPPAHKRIVKDRTIWGQVTVFVAAAAPVSTMQPGYLQDACLFLIAAAVCATIFDRVRDLRQKGP